jgi:hypothetical protein
MPEWIYNVLPWINILCWCVLFLFVGQLVVFFYIWWAYGSRSAAACFAFRIECDYCKRERERIEGKDGP